MKTNAIFSLENILTDFFRPIYVDVQASTLVKNKYIISLSANGLDNTISSHKKVMQVFKEYINNTTPLIKELDISTCSPTELDINNSEFTTYKAQEMLKYFSRSVVIG